ncbi:MAG: DUF5127 domain-containing protein, partial [Sphingobacteriaceae bacterium]
MKKIVFLLGILSQLMLSAQTDKAPAYPLINHDPYFSIWSFSDTLTSTPTKHWTGADQPLMGLAKVDGKMYRFMGNKSVTYQTILPAADEKVYETKYTETAPVEGWMNAAFNDAEWTSGNAPFGNNETRAKTVWKSKDLWVRRTFDYSPITINKLYLKLINDDNIEVYLNGEKLYENKGYTDKYIYIPISNSQILKKGRNVMAIHIANTAGGQFLDAGLVQEPKGVKDMTAVAEQKAVNITATKTAYQFKVGGVDLTLSFISPLLMNDLNLLSRPVSYITTQVQANDGKHHIVQVYFGASTDIAVNVAAQEVVTKQYQSDGLAIMRAGTKEQPVLQKKGDNLRIDWGYMYIAVPKTAGAKQYITSSTDAAPSFEKNRFTSAATE